MDYVIHLGSLSILLKPRKHSYDTDLCQGEGGGGISEHFKKCNHFLLWPEKNIKKFF